MYQNDSFLLFLDVVTILYMTRIVCHKTIVLIDCETGQDPAEPHRIQSWTNRVCYPNPTQGSLCLIPCGSSEDRHIDM